MANTNAQLEAEKWIRQLALPKLFNQVFERRALILRGGGEFDFDAVSRDGSIVVVISTSSGVTTSGRKATPKLLKIRSDVLWFYMLCNMPQRSILVFTDDAMLQIVREQQLCGRFPPEFELLKVELPPELAEKVKESQRLAAEEVTPIKEISR